MMRESVSRIGQGTLARVLTAGAVRRAPGWASYRAMLYDLLGRMISIPRWRTLLVFYVSGFGAASYIALSHKLKNRTRKSSSPLAKNTKDTTMGKGPKNDTPPNSALRKGPQSFFAQMQMLLGIAFPSVVGREAGHLLLYTVLLVARVRLSILLADLGARGVRLMVQKDWTALFREQSKFMSLCIPVAVIQAWMRYEQNQLALRLRHRMMEHIHTRYLDQHNVFYRMTSLGKNILSTIDQRITQDVNEFASNFAALYGNILKPTAELLLYARKVHTNLGGLQLAVFVSYFAAASWWLKALMPSFGKLTAAQQEAEGVFRADHARIISHAEEIAFLRGGAVERTRVSNSFATIADKAQTTMSWRALMSFLDTTAVKHFGTLMSYDVMIPAMYLGQPNVQLDSVADRTQFMIQSMTYFHGLSSALNTLYQNSYQGLTKLSGMTTRVAELVTDLDTRGACGRPDQVAIACVEKYHATAPPTTTARPPPEYVVGNRVQLAHVDVVSPDGDLLVSDLCVDVRPGTHLIIEGVNGTGKSSLLRTIGGLWPLVSGTLTRPADIVDDAGNVRSAIAFIPQVPFICPGSLRSQLLYPLQHQWHGSGASQCDLGGDGETARMGEVMRAVGLEYLVTREGGWDVVKDYTDVLSGGERQRIAFARVLFQKPLFAILDEATASVSHDIELKLVEACICQGITVISVSHRKNLRQCHKQMLHLLNDGKGGWELVDISAGYTAGGDVNESIVTLAD
eukprot:m.321679 g.321679  ORF g.321679 m.321679 type:complete len:741 (-) comp20338_c0_seq7:2065-4287(-)